MHFNQENDLLNLRQAEVSADVHENTTDENNHALARGLSTLQRHVSVRLQNIGSHLKKDTQENNNTNETIDEDESIQLNDYEDELKV